MSDHYEVVGVSSPGTELDDVANDEGIRVIPLTMTRVISPLKDLKALFALYRILKKEKPLIVHSHTPKAGIVGMAAAYMARVPLRLHTVAGMPLLEARGNKRRVLNWVEKMTYRFATHVYPNSHELEKIIIKEKFAKPSKIKVIANGSSNGIDVDYFDPQTISESAKTDLLEQLSLTANDFVFVFVGRLVGDKGINEMVAAFSEIHKRHPQTKLLLVGPEERELDPLLKNTLTEIDTNRAILAVGYQNDVRPYFAISNALVFPSYREGFPNVVMQAGAMGLPSIVTNINGCNEIVINGENGVWVQPKSTEELQESMLRFIENPDLTKKLQANARKMIVDRYQRQYVWNALLEEYKKLEANV